jgi:hypothetical protein
MADKTTKVLQDIAAGIITPEEGQKILQASQEKKNGVSLKVGPKGAIGVYGLRVRPICIYYKELTAMLDYMLTDTWEFNENMEEFLRENDDKMSKGKVKKSVTVTKK